MHKLLSFYNKNKRTIFIVLFCIIVGYMLLKGLNSYYADRKKEQLEEFQKTSNSSSSNTTTVIENQEFDLTGNKKTVEKITSDKETLESFFESCNNKEINKAYNMITDECKKLQYPTAKDFATSYYGKNFKTTKNCVIENWSGNIYRIKYKEDMLSTGKVGTDSYTEDYITVIDVNGEKKLNINSYVGSYNISKKEENSVVTITANSKDVYMDYEVYHLTIKNNTKNNVQIDDLQNTNSIYLLESKGAKYSFVNNELIKEQLNIGSNESIQIDIKFNHSYRANKQIKSITFSGIERENSKNKDVITINF